MQISVFESLKYPSKLRAVPNQQEELFILGWDIIKDEVNRLLERGTAMSRKGKDPSATFQAANYFFYLLHYAINIKNYTELFDGCVDLSRYNIDCVEDNLPCLSANLDADLKQAWYKLKEEFGITDEALCGECCLGIGGMVIDDINECNAFIIGGCVEDEIEGFEFADCEFPLEEFLVSDECTEATVIDIDSLFINGDQTIDDGIVIIGEDDCLVCEEPEPEPEPEIDQYLLNFSEANKDYLILQGADINKIPTSGNWYCEIKIDFRYTIITNDENVLISYSPISTSTPNSNWELVAIQDAFTNSLRFSFNCNNDSTTSNLDPNVRDDGTYIIRFGFKGNNSFIKVDDGLTRIVGFDEVLGNNQRPIQQNNQTGVTVNSRYVNDFSNETTLQSNIIVHYVDINGDKFEINEGSGFNISSVNGLLGNGFTDLDETYWNNNVWVKQGDVIPIPPNPEEGEYILNRKEITKDLLVLAPNNPEVYDIPSTGLWKVSITCNIDDLLADTSGGALISRTWTNNIGINAEKWRVVYQGFAKQFFFVHRINLISLDISQLGLTGYVEFTFGFDDNGSFIEANGVEIGRDGNTARPLNQPQIEGVVVGAAYQNFNGGNSTFVDFFQDLRIKNIKINNEEWKLNEGQGFSVTSENGITGEGQTSSPDGLTYWNENVWQEIL